MVLAALFGFLRLLNQAAQAGQGDFLPLELIFLIALIVGPLGGYAVVYVVSIYIRWVFSWFRANLNPRDVRVVLAWSLLPVIVGLLLWLPFMLFYGQNWFGSTVTVSAPWVMSMIPLLTNIQYFLIGWSLVIFMVGISLLSTFSEAKSLLVVLAGVAAIVVPIGLVSVFLAP